MDKYKFNKFDLIVENVKSNLIYEEGVLKKLAKFFSDRWGLDEEIKILIPFIETRVKHALSNFYENNVPGPLATTGFQIEPINIGSEESGFKLTWDLEDRLCQE